MSIVKNGRSIGRLSSFSSWSGWVSSPLDFLRHFFPIGFFILIRSRSGWPVLGSCFGWHHTSAFARGNARAVGNTLSGDGGTEMSPSSENARTAACRSQEVFCSDSDGRISLHLGSTAGAFAELDGDVHLLAAAIDRDVYRVARALAIEDNVDVELTGDFVAIDGDDDIAADVNAAHAGLYQAIPAANPSNSGRAAGSGDFNEQAFLNRQVQRFTKPATYGQGLHAKESAMNAAVGDEVVGDTFRGVNGDSEADSGGRASGRINGGIDANYFTVGVDERAAGVAAIDGRIGLNGFVDERGLAGLHGTAQGADDASCERGLEPQRIADGENFLAHLQCGGVAEREGDKFLSLGINLDQSDVVALVGADELRGVVRLVTQNDFDGLSAFDNVKVCEDIAAGIDDKSGARAFDGHGVHEKVVFGGFGEDVGDGGGSLAVNAHVDGFVGGESGVALSVRSGAARQGFHAAWLAGSVSCAGPVDAQNEHQRGKNDACTVGGVCCGHGSRPFLIHSIP